MKKEKGTERLLLTTFWKNFFQLKEISAEWFENLQLKSIIYTKTKSKFQSLTTRQEEILVLANQCVTEENPLWLRKGEEVKVLTETLKENIVILFPQN